ncbi:MAG TPA: hypothetical protein PKX87_09015, partial [Alphaproteobacteria bacterium]|nr:hypothetical protein [Alphaproteobacteria bacterium]
FAYRYEYLLFVPVDMPLIDPAALRFLIEGGHAAFFQSFPLPAVLRTAEYSVEETSSVRALLAAAGAREAPLAPAWEKTMVNLNTPQDWEALAS